MIRRILYQNTILFRLFLVYTVWLCICQFFFLVFFFFWILFNAKIGPQLEIFLAVFPLILHLNLRFLSLVGRTLIRFIALSLFSFLLSSLFCFVMYSKRKKIKIVLIYIIFLYVFGRKQCLKLKPQCLK